MTLDITEDDIEQAKSRAGAELADTLVWLRADDGEAAYEAGGSWARALAGPLADLLELSIIWGGPHAAAAHRVAERIRS